MRRLSALVLLILGLASVAMATGVSPEIDPSSAGSALTLVAGAALLLKGRRRK